MALIKGLQPVEHLINVSKLNAATDNLSLSVGNNVAPTIDLNPKYTTFAKAGSISISGTHSQIAPYISDKTFYLTGITCAYYKDAACDIATGYITISVDFNGTNQGILILPVITATAEKGNAEIDFAYPIKLTQGSAGSAVYMSGSFTAGVLLRNLGIRGFYL